MTRVSKVKRAHSRTRRPPSTAKPRAARAAHGATFLARLAALLRSRGLKVPAGLTSAPPIAYASQPPEFVETLAALGDDELSAHAERVAGYARRLSERTTAAWETSPLIAEIRRRKLKEPKRPARVVGLAFSLKKPLSDWTDRDLIAAAKEWSRRGS